jgi:hypothetical protein
MAHIFRTGEARTAPSLLHPPVNHLHSVEKSGGYGSAFFIDSENEKSKKAIVL